MGEVRIVVKRRKRPKGPLEVAAELTLARGSKPVLTASPEEPISSELEKGGEDASETSN